MIVRSFDSGWGESAEHLPPPAHTLIAPIHPASVSWVVGITCGQRSWRFSDVVCIAVPETAAARDGFSPARRSLGQRGCGANTTSLRRPPVPTRSRQPLRCSEGTAGASIGGERRGGGVSHGRFVQALTHRGFAAAEAAAVTPLLNSPMKRRTKNEIKTRCA